MSTTGNTDKKKILCISVMQNWGGGEEFLLTLNINVKDFVFEIVTPEGDSEKKFRGNGIKTIINNQQKKIYRKSGWNLLAVVKIILGVKLSSLKFLSLLKKEDPGLVLANGLFAAFYILPAVILSGRKLIVIQHLIFNEKAIEKKIIKLAYRFSEKIVCVSYAVKNNLSSMLNWTEKLIIIPNGIRVKDTPESFSNKTGSIKFGVIGSIIRIKGIDLILKVMVDFLKSGKVELHIFGKTSDNTDSANYKNEIMNIIEKYGIAERVIFHGHIESKFDIYSRVNVVINYSTVPESFSYSVLEAMAHKKIVIAANAGGPKEIINDGENGFLVETQNLNQLKSKTEYCIENFYSDKFQLIREKAFETVKNNYSIEKFSKDYSKLFHSLID